MLKYFSYFSFIDLTSANAYGLITKVSYCFLKMDCVFEFSASVAALFVAAHVC